MNGSEMRPFSLSFRYQGLEARYNADAAKERWPILMAIFCFDILTYTLRVGARLMSSGPEYTLSSTVKAMLPQFLNMLGIYLAAHWINRRSRKAAGKPWAAFQEEVLLSLVMATAICFLLLNLRPESARDYIFACFFLICATLLLRLRWLVGTCALALPLLLLYGAQLAGAAWPKVLPADADVHLTVAWAAGALMSYLTDQHRRQLFANAHMARAAASGGRHGLKRCSQRHGDISKSCVAGGLVN